MACNGETNDTEPSYHPCDGTTSGHVISDRHLYTPTKTMTLLSSSPPTLDPAPTTPSPPPVSLLDDVEHQLQNMAIQEEPLGQDDKSLPMYPTQPQLVDILEERTESPQPLDPYPATPHSHHTQDDEAPKANTLILEMFQPQPRTPPKSNSLPPMFLQPTNGNNNSSSSNNYNYNNNNTYKPAPRNRSPYARPHIRTQSSPLSAPPMARAHSSPTFASPSPALSLPPSVRSSSPLRSPKRVRSPFRSASDESYPAAFLEPDIESIDEDEPLDITPRAPESRLSLSTSGLGTLEASPILYPHTFPRSSSTSAAGTRRRPTSPLHHVLSTADQQGTPTSATSSSPLLSARRYDEAFPPDLSYPHSRTSSSVPSTPTSARSRSPSISSLETIPDSPDAEEEAMERDRVERGRAQEGGMRRGSFDVGGVSRGGAGFGTRDKRKRWSVCGAEKRGDLNLETIWEDGA